MSVYILSPETAGPTGLHPQGKCSPDDKGELNVRVEEIEALKVIKLIFGYEVEWLALGPPEARAFANRLIEFAEKHGA